MKIIDISRDVLNTPAYPGDPETFSTSVKSIKNGDHCNLSDFYTGLHTATHIDAPLHFIDGGESIDKLDLGIFIGDCVVVEAPPGPITGAFADEHFPTKNCERLLIKSGGKAHLIESSAYFMSDNGIKLVGTDSDSIGIHENNIVVHKALLGRGTVILEGLDLENVAPGRYFLMAQPLKISGTEASLCRALLVEDHLFWTGD